MRYRKRLLLLLLSLHTVYLMAGNVLNQTSVIVPDSIHEKLVKSYDSEVDRSVAFCPVYNLLQPKNRKWGNGIYRYRMQGDHFPTKICVFYNSKLYIFKNEGWLNPLGVIEEFAECIRKINISNRDSVRYLNAVYIYLKDEEGMDYGITIK